MADRTQGPGPVGGSLGSGARNPFGSDPGAGRPDLEGARVVSEDVGSLPVPRSVRESKGERLPPPSGSPYDLERGLMPGARRPVRPPPRGMGGPGGLTLDREKEAQLRRAHARAARTPEELGRALSRLGDTGLRDPQRGREAGPPLPGEPGYRGES